VRRVRQLFPRHDGRPVTGPVCAQPRRRACLYRHVKTNNLFLNTAWHAGLDALLRLRPRLPTSSAAVSPQVDFAFTGTNGRASWCPWNGSLITTGLRPGGWADYMTACVSRWASTGSCAVLPVQRHPRCGQGHLDQRAAVMARVNGWSYTMPSHARTCSNASTAGTKVARVQRVFSGSGAVCQRRPAARPRLNHRRAGQHGAAARRRHRNPLRAISAGAAMNVRINLTSSATPPVRGGNQRGDAAGHVAVFSASWVWSWSSITTSSTRCYLASMSARPGKTSW
jgi:hypothetical protein